MNALLKDKPTVISIFLLHRNEAQKHIFSPCGQKVIVKPLRIWKAICFIFIVKHNNFVLLLLSTVSYPHQLPLICWQNYVTCLSVSEICIHSKVYIKETQTGCKIISLKLELSNLLFSFPNYSSFICYTASDSITDSCATPIKKVSLAS